MATAFSRGQLLAAFDEVGHAAVSVRVHLDIAVYGGSASDFRFATEDVDIAEIDRPWPDWLAAAVARIAERNHWPDDWLNACGPDGFRSYRPLHAGAEAQGIANSGFRCGFARYRRCHIAIARSADFRCRAGHSGPGSVLSK